jgi:hypothetical protein
VLKFIEELCRRQEHTIAALEAVSTFSVVVVSLWLANRASQTRLTAYITKHVVIDATTTERPEYLVAIITNTGVIPLYIPLSFLLWTRPYRRKGGWLVGFPLDYYRTDKAIQQRQYPVKLEPKASQLVHISDIVTFRQVMQECLLSQGRIRRFIFRFVRAMVQTTDGRRFRAKISKEIRQELHQIQERVRRISKDTY